MQGILLNIWRKLHLSTSVQLFFMRLVNDRFLIGVTGIFIDDNKRVLLVKHSYRGGNRWSLPGGYAKRGEHPKETLEREVKEETGLIVSADEYSKIRTDRNSARFDITFNGKFIGGVFTPSKEVTEAKLFKFKDLPVLPESQLMFISRVIKNS